MAFSTRLLLRPFRSAKPNHGSRVDLQGYRDIKQAGVFDPDWYVRQYPDVAAEGIDPLRHYMIHGWRELRNPNRLFDTGWYLDAYPDVRTADYNPLLHYVRHGAAERRDTGPDFRPSIFQDPHTPRGSHHLAAAITYLNKIDHLQVASDRSTFSSPRVLIVAELSIPQCKKYRVTQKCELLRLMGIESTVLNWHDLATNRSALLTHSIIIFYRVPATDIILDYIKKAKSLGLPVLWEVDDLIFDPNAYFENASLKALTPETQRGVLSGVPLYRNAMLACDETIASTRSLAQAMRDAGVTRAHVVENALDAGTLAIASAATEKVVKTDGAVRIVYGSGTNTHDEDFQQAADAILACLAAYPHVRLRIVGQLTLPPGFARFGGRIERYATTSYDKYFALLAACDISIAPLEPTLFNDAKSNIKYIEASIIGLPSVCSPRAEFAGIIDHGRNGLLADSERSWFAALESLILDRRSRVAMGASAKQAVLARYSPARIATTQLGPVIKLLEPVRKPLRVLSANVFFEPRSFGGATIVAEQMARLLNARDDTEVIVFTTAPAGTAEPYQLLRYDAGSLPVFAVCVPDTRDPALEFDTPHTVHAFREVLRGTRPDVVHLHSIQTLGARLLEACEEEGVPVVVTLHDAWWICGRQFMIKGDGRYCFQTQIDLNVCSACVPDPGLNLYRQYRLRDMLDRADLLLAPSEFFRGIYAANGFPSAQLKVNRNGVSRPVDFRRSPSSRLRFGYVGGNAPLKGAAFIQRVFAELDRSDYELVIIDNLLSLGFPSISPRDWPVKGELSILPAFDQSTMDDFYSRIDVLLFPTQWKESFGLTVREALIRDIWVIATDAGGVVEDLVDGENGDIIPLLDDGTALGIAVERALDRTDALMTHRNPHKARIADQDQQAEELHAYLSAVAGRNRMPRRLSA